MRPTRLHLGCTTASARPALRLPKIHVRVRGTDSELRRERVGFGRGSPFSGFLGLWMWVCVASALLRRGAYTPHHENTSSLAASNLCSADVVSYCAHRNLSAFGLHRLAPSPCGAPIVSTWHLQGHRHMDRLLEVPLIAAAARDAAACCASSSSAMLSRYAWQVWVRCMRCGQDAIYA